MKILHAADLHIDSPLGGLSAYEGAPVEEIRGATRRAVENLVKAAIDHQVGLVVLAGDIFDGDWRDYSTGLFWNEQLGRLHEAKIPVVTVAGNHDAASEISRDLHLPPNVEQLSNSEPETKIFDDLEIAVTGQSYHKKAVTADLARGFPSADPKLFTIGLLHTSLDGRPGHDKYAPSSTEMLRSKGYNYWALGHVHEQEVVCKDPWIVFPGNLQGRKSIETGAKGATLITVHSGQVTKVEHLELDDVRWHTCEIDATNMDRAEEVRSAITDRFASINTENGHRLAAIRVVITGASPAHPDIWKDPRGFEADVRSLANLAGRSWVEKVKVNTSHPLDLARARDDDVIGILAKRIEALRADDQMLAEYESTFDDLRKKIGADARSGPDSPIKTSSIGSSQHLAENLDASLELVVALLARNNQENHGHAD